MYQKLERYHEEDLLILFEDTPRPPSPYRGHASSQSNWLLVVNKDGAHFERVSYVKVTGAPNWEHPEWMAAKETYRHQDPDYAGTKFGHNAQTYVRFHWMGSWDAEVADFIGSATKDGMEVNFREEFGRLKGRPSYDAGPARSTDDEDVPGFDLERAPKDAVTVEITVTEKVRIPSVVFPATDEGILALMEEAERRGWSDTEVESRELNCPDPAHKDQVIGQRCYAALLSENGNTRALCTD